MSEPICECGQGLYKHQHVWDGIEDTFGCPWNECKMFTDSRIAKLEKVVEAAKVCVQNNRTLTVGHPHFDWESLKDLFTAVQELEGE